MPARVTVRCIYLEEPTSYDIDVKIACKTTIGELGRMFWPKLSITVSCLSVWIFDQYLESYITVSNPESRFVGLNDLVEFNFGNSQQESMIKPPGSYVVVPGLNGPMLSVEKEKCGRRRRRGSTTLFRHSTTPTDSDSDIEVIDVVLRRPPAREGGDDDCVDPPSTTPRHRVQYRNHQRRRVRSRTDSPQTSRSDSQGPPIFDCEDSESDSEFIAIPDVEGCLRVYVKDADRIIDIARKCRLARTATQEVKDALVTAMGQHLINTTPNHSPAQRLEFAQQFAGRILDLSIVSIEDFTNGSDSGLLDVYLKRRGRKRRSDTPGALEPAKYLEDLRCMNLDNPSLDDLHRKSFEYRRKVTNKYKFDGLDVAENVLDQFPYLLARPDLLAIEYKLSSKRRLYRTTYVDFESEWTVRYAAAIEHLFAMSCIPPAEAVFRHPVCDPGALFTLNKLIALLRSIIPSISVAMIERIIIVVVGMDIEKIFKYVRDELHIKHPVILADEDGFAVYVSRQIVFMKTESLPSALAQFAQVHTVFRIEPEEEFEPLINVLDAMQGLALSYRRKSRKALASFLTTLKSK